MDSFLQFDQQFFFFINGQLQNPFFDYVMPYMRDKNFWIPLYASLLLYFVWRYKKSAWLPILLAALTVVMTDQLSSSVIKPLVHRLRPCNDPLIASQVHLLVGCGSGFSFVSSHAANHFGIACFIIVLLRNRFKWITAAAISWAALVCFAQMYVGLHYPLDILGGAVVGIVAGTLTGIFCKRRLERNYPRSYS